MPVGLRMTAEETDRVIDAIGDALADAELTVAELTEAIVARVGSWAGDRVMSAFQDAWPRWRQIEVVATNRGAMCFGPEPADGVHQFGSVVAGLPPGAGGRGLCRVGGPLQRLLPYFDAFVVGCHPRDRLFPDRAWQRALAGGQAGNFPVLLIDGVVAGVWHQRRSGRKIAMTVEPLAPLRGRHRRLLDDEAHRVAAVLQGRAELTIGVVTVGGHA